MESVLQKNYDESIAKKQIMALLLYGVGILIVLSWAILCTPDEFLNLGSKGINKDTIAALPKSLKLFYKGFPNLSSLLCYVLFALAAFMTLKKKNRLLQFINITSFAMIVWLLFLLS